MYRDSLRFLAEERGNCWERGLEGAGKEISYIVTEGERGGGKKKKKKKKPKEAME